MQIIESLGELSCHATGNSARMSTRTGLQPPPTIDANVCITSVPGNCFYHNQVVLVVKNLLAKAGDK